MAYRWPVTFWLEGFGLVQKGGMEGVFLDKVLGKGNDGPEDTVPFGELVSGDG